MYLWEVFKTFLGLKRDEIRDWWNWSGRNLFAVIAAFAVAIIIVLLTYLIIGQIEWWIAGGVPSWLHTEDVLNHIKNQNFWMAKWMMGFLSIYLVIIIALLTTIIFVVVYWCVIAPIKWIASNLKESFRIVNTQRRKEKEAYSNERN